MNRQRLEQLARLWWEIALLRALCFAIGAMYFALIPFVLYPTYFWAAFPLAVFVGTMLGCLWYSRTWKLDAAGVARHLDRTHSELEESSGLWLYPPTSLTLLERLQLRRLDAAAERFAGSPSSPSRFGHPPEVRQWLIIGFVAAGGIALFIVNVSLNRADTRVSPSSAVIAPRAARRSSAPTVWPKIIGGSLTITPPAYTGHPPRQTPDFNTEIEEDATVTWTLALDQPVREAHLVFGPAATDVLPLQPTANHLLLATRHFPETTLYALAATLPDGTAWTPPEIYSLKVIKDQPPTVRILHPPEPRTVIIPSPPAPSNDSVPVPSAPHAASCFVEVQAGDDYALADAHLVATVAKGSGEAVKFREQVLLFDGDDENEPIAGTTRTRRFTKTLDLAALGLEPGDELYFYVEARDNRQPTPNYTRSETRFLVLQGPANITTSTGRGVAGVNLVPQYFRSERQLIIDTEKLLADRPTLPDAEFRSRANDLGADQALLRLRYGQFLGEDQETDPLTDHTEVNLDPLQGNAPEHSAGPRAAASVTERFRQEHSAQDHEGGSDDARDASVRPPPAVPPAADQVRQTYVDSHDTYDKATYFDPRSKGTMKDTLAAMWEAEGALRIAQPQDALAPEHRALDILKDLQQSDRAYVQHVGFDAPPLKIDERRLKGDAADVPAKFDAAGFASPPDTNLAAIRAALATLPVAGPARVGTLRRVEPILTAAAIHRPDDFLPGLQSLRRLLATDTNPDPADRSALERSLLRLLPPANPLPVRAQSDVPFLAAPYFQALSSTGSAKP